MGNGDAERDHDDIVLRVPACDTCRLRKIKCDRQVPCNSCVASKIPCRTTKRAPEKKQRVLLSSKYDEGLANVNRRLEDLSSALQILLENSSQKSNEPSTIANVHYQGREASVAPEADREVPYEGDSSFNAHSKYITETLGNALSTPSAASTSPHIDQAAIQKLLKDVAAAQTPSSSTPSQQPKFSHFPELSKMTLPSTPLVLKLLKIAGNMMHRWFIDYQVMDFEDFKALCSKVYFPADEYSIFTWLIVNGGIFFLFRDADGDLHERLGIDKAEVRANMGLCKQNIDTAIHALPLCIDPSLEACQALTLAATIAMEDAKTALAWKLTSVASRMCLDLGLHRLHRDGTAVNRRQRLAFWTVYAMDKALAFNFGRTPTIHDYDITIEHPTCPGDVNGPWGVLHLSTLDFCILQGEIYQQLFSTTAQKQPKDIRSQRAQEFAARIQRLRDPVQSFGAEQDGANKELGTFAMLSTNLLIGCMLAIVYRVIPPPQPAHPLQYCDEAIENSRSALEYLHEAWRLVQKQSKSDPAENFCTFLNWTILFVPFVPFVILFGNSIAQRHEGDLELLRKTVTVLEAIADRSPAGRKLYGACLQFTKIAETMLAAGFKNSTSQPSPIPDPYAIDMQMLQDFPMLQQDWDGMLNEFDLGLGAESARDMTSYFEPFMSGNIGASHDGRDRAWSGGMTEHSSGLLNFSAP